MSRKKKAGSKKTEEEKGLLAIYAVFKLKLTRKHRKITRELAPLQPWKRNKERVKRLCDDLLRKYPGRDFTKLPRVELAELIAVVQREFDKEGWDSKNAESAIKLVVEGAKVAHQRKSSRKVRGDLVLNVTHALCILWLI
jgi:hypothetical protein